MLESHDVLRRGPVADLIKPGVNRFAVSVAEALGSPLASFGQEWPIRLYDDWAKTLCRLLLRIRNYRHGGSLLFTPDSAADGLSIKYQLHYDRLRTALQHIAIHRQELRVADDEIYEIMELEEADTVPIITYLDSSIAGDELHDSSSGVGRRHLVCLPCFPRVDGVVLLTFDLEVKGFGVEILRESLPLRVLRSTTASGSRAGLRAADYHSLGTRHRSMMRYCYAVPGSLELRRFPGDGDIRVMTRLGDALRLLGTASACNSMNSSARREHSEAAGRGKTEMPNR